MVVVVPPPLVPNVVSAVPSALKRLRYRTSPLSTLVATTRPSDCTSGAPWPLSRPVPGTSASPPVPQPGSGPPTAAAALVTCTPASRPRANSTATRQRRADMQQCNAADPLNPPAAAG